MKLRYRKFRRGNTWYVHDSQPEADKGGKVSCRQWSLGTKNESEAERMVAVMNEPYRFAAFNFQMARTHLQMSDPKLTKRTWRHVMEAAVQTKHGPTKIRYERAVGDEAFEDIRDTLVLETTADDFFKVMKKGTVSTNVYLRRWHNFALDMNWLLVPVIPKNRWPAVKFRDKRGITLDEHQRIVAREGNPERRAFYEVCWHVGGSQSASDSKLADECLAELLGFGQYLDGPEVALLDNLLCLLRVRAASRDRALLTVGELERHTYGSVLSCLRFHRMLKGCFLNFKSVGTFLIAREA